MDRMTTTTCSKHSCPAGESHVVHRVTESTHTLFAALVVAAPVRADDVLVVVLVLAAGGADVRVAGIFHGGGCMWFCSLDGKNALIHTTIV